MPSISAQSVPKSSVLRPCHAGQHEGRDVTASGRLQPPAASPSVAPVVMTSSMRRTGLSCRVACAEGGTAKAPFTLRIRWCRLNPPCSRCAAADQDVRGKHAKPVNSAEMCKLRRLIVAPPVIAAAMKRDRHDQRIVLYQLDKEPRHETCQEGRQLQAVTMLEGKNQVARAAGVRKQPRMAASRGGVAQQAAQSGSASVWPKGSPQRSQIGAAIGQDLPSRRYRDLLFRQTAAQHALVRHNQVGKPAAGFRKWPAKCSVRSMMRTV